MSLPFRSPFSLPRPLTIRWRLMLLVISYLVPGLLGMGWLVTNALQAEQAAHERTLRDTARALSAVVDSELSQRLAILRVMAQSRWLDSGHQMSRHELLGFEQLVHRSLVGVHGWIEVRGPNGLLLDSRFPANTQVQRGTFVPLSSAPEITALNMGADTPHAAIVQPVERDGQLIMNLVLALMPSELQRIVDSQQLPADWIGAVMDSRGTVVARHPGAGKHTGRSATRAMRDLVAASAEGHFSAVSLDGREMEGYFSRSPQGWTYLSAMPRPTYGLGITHATLKVIAGALLLLALPVLATLWVAHRMVLPLQTLKEAAASIQGCQPLPYQASGVVEFDELARALSDAAEVVHRSRSELEHQVEAAIARTRQAEQRVSKSQRVEALGRLTGGVAHDFNNLLGIISNSLHLIERNAKPADIEMPAAAIRRAVGTGSQLTQHLLRFAGRQPVRPQILALQGWLPELLDLLRSILGRRIETVVRVHAETPPIHVDPGELELALVNLVLNARDAMPLKGRLRVSAQIAESSELEGLQVSPQQQFVSITVSDNGSGLTPEVAARAFEPFFTTKAAGLGTGLGLSQVHGFCTQAGGAVRLSSTPGLGTSVSLVLPTARTTVSTPEVPLPVGDIAGLRLLLVEDNDELGAVTAELLREHGMQVQRAENAAEALRLLERHPYFDAVLSDVMMPGDMDGLALAREVRRAYPSLPIVLISGFNVSTGAHEFPILHKPCSALQMVRTLHEVVSREREQDNGTS